MQCRQRFAPATTVRLIHCGQSPDFITVSEIELPDLTAIEAESRRLALAASPFELHGGLCGWLAGGGASVREWPAKVLADDALPAPPEGSPLDELRLASAAQLADRSFDFVLLLPDADASLAERSGAMRVLARALLRQGRLDQARGVVASGIEAADDADPSLPELLAIDGTLLSLGGERELARQCFDRAEALAERLNLARDAAQVHGYRAFSYEREGNLEVHGLLRPERPIVVEHRHSFGRGHEI